MSKKKKQAETTYSIDVSTTRRVSYEARRDGSTTASITATVYPDDVEINSSYYRPSGFAHGSSVHFSRIPVGQWDEFVAAIEKQRRLAGCDG